MIGRQLGHFRVEGPLGAGGMGEVYRARDERLDREVAIKVLPEAVAHDPDRLARFEREARALRSCRTRTSSRSTSSARDGETAYVVTELLQGETLRQRIARERLPWRKAVEIAAGIADGLASAHAHGICHRDLKPENLFLTTDGQPRILDFGLARFDLGTDSRALTLPTPPSSTRPGVVLGTVGYLSPEQARASRATRAATSSRSAASCSRCSPVRRAFARESVADTLRAIVSDPLPDVADLGLGIPPEVGRIVAHCVEKDRDDRFQSARDLAFDLRASLTAVHVADSGDRAPGGARSRAAGSGWLVALGLAAIVLALAGGTWLALRPGPTRSEGAGVGPRAARASSCFPFENLGTQEDAYFAAGMTEEITSRLAGVQALAVTSRTTAMEYDRAGKTLKKVGADLGVDYVLEGTVRWDRTQAGSGRVRITPQLIRVSDDTHLWASQLRAGDGRRLRPPVRRGRRGRACAGADPVARGGERGRASPHEGPDRIRPVPAGEPDCREQLRRPGERAGRAAPVGGCSLATPGSPRPTPAWHGGTCRTTGSTGIVPLPAWSGPGSPPSGRWLSRPRFRRPGWPSGTTTTWGTWTTRGRWPRLGRTPPASRGPRGHRPAGVRPPPRRPHRGLGATRSSASWPSTRAAPTCGTTSPRRTGSSVDTQRPIGLRASPCPEPAMGARVQLPCRRPPLPARGRRRGSRAARPGARGPGSARGRRASRAARPARLPRASLRPGRLARPLARHRGVLLAVGPTCRCRASSGTP